LFERLWPLSSGWSAEKNLWQAWRAACEGGAASSNRFVTAASSRKPSTRTMLRSFTWAQQRPERQLRS
jgi:hypothetical protein